MKKKIEQMINFFKHNSVKLTVPFPISCFQENIWASLEPFEFDVLLKGKKRNFIFLGKNYNQFLSDDRIFKFFNSFRKIKSYKVNNHCFSYTDIYELNKIEEFNHALDHGKSYSSEMYGIYKEFQENVNKSYEKYDYHAYIDIQTYYDRIYTHSLKGIQVKNIFNFLDYKKEYKNETWLKKNTKKWINVFLNLLKAKWFIAIGQINYQ